MTLPAVLRLGASLAILGLVWWQIDAPDAAARLAEAHPGWLLAGLAALWAQTLLSAWRWRLVGRALGVMIAPARALSEYFLAQLVNQTLPGGVLGDLSRAWRSAEGVGIARAGGAVLVERVLGQVALMALLVAGLVWAARAPGQIRVPAEVLIPAGLVLGLLIAGLGVVLLLPRLAQASRALLPAGVMLPQLALSLGAAALNLLAFDFAARATGTTLPPAAIAVLVPLILLTMLVPVTVSGWGLREGAAAALFPLAGASDAAGLAASTAFGLIFLISTLIGTGACLAHGAVTGRAATARPALRPSRARPEQR